MKMKNNKMRSIPTLILLFSLFILTKCQTDFDHSPSVVPQVDSYIQPYVDISMFDGTIVIVKDNEVLFSKGFGSANYDLFTPNNAKTKFRLASVSKAFTKIAIGYLVEQDLISFNTTLDTFIPDYPQGDIININHLLFHRSGVPHINNLPWYDEHLEHQYSLPEIIEQFKNLPLDFHPGTQESFSNGGYTLLAYIIEEVSGKSFSQFMREDILDPMGLFDTGVEEAELFIENRAQGYLPGLESIEQRVDAPYVEMSLKIGSGSIYSTGADLFRFDQLLFKDNLIRKETYNQLFPTSNGRLIFQGSLPGFNIHMRKLIQQNVTVIVLSNNYASNVIFEIGSVLENIAKGLGARPPLVNNQVTVDGILLSKYTGSYLTPDNFVFEIKMENNHLVLYDPLQQPIELLVPQSDSEFYLRLSGLKLTFRLNIQEDVIHVDVVSFLSGESFRIFPHP